jgi:hypothetical protein
VLWPCACMWSVCAWGMCVYACLCVFVCGWCGGMVCGCAGPAAIVMALGWLLWRGHVCACVCVVVVVFVGACVFVCVRCGVVLCVLRCCVDAVGGGGLCGCTCIVWADGD